MAEVVPAILADSEELYRKQIGKVVHSAHRLQIDLTDGVFAEAKTIKPAQAWWPVGLRADFHLMYRHPGPAVRVVVEHQPNLVIVHAEAEGDFSAFADFCHKRGVKTGIALLPETQPDVILPALHMIDHVLIFSGSLGRYGGRADLKLLNKSSILKTHKPELEIGWDGGVDDQNVAQLVAGGIDVLNSGGYIQNAPDAGKALAGLQRIADETGTT